MKVVNYAPIIVFAYNRLGNLTKTIDTLVKAEGVEKTDLFIWCDGNKSDQDKFKVEEVRKYVRQYKNISRFRTVTINESPTNKGLASSVISGVSSVLEKYSKVIVVEDDLLVSADFIEYMNEALMFYEKDQRIFSIGGWTPDLPFLEKYDKDIIISNRFECWGWGIWKDRWETIVWDYDRYSMASRNEIKCLSTAGRDLKGMFYSYLDGKIDSWAVRAACHLIWNNKYVVVPSKSKVKNIGLDGSGTNCGNREQHPSEQISNSNHVNFITMYSDDELNRRLWLYYSYGTKGEKLSFADMVRYFIHHSLRGFHTITYY